MAVYVYALFLMFGGYFITQHPEFFFRLRWFPFFQRFELPKFFLAIIVLQGWISVGAGILIMIGLLFS